MDSPQAKSEGFAMSQTLVGNRRNQTGKLSDLVASDNPLMAAPEQLDALQMVKTIKESVSVCQTA
ncbi:hypothetical protein [Aminobacter sp. AP02]|uniref:hypothetical protein n=1 Tax=Aminobacter sp. AP02 TaxID=2135737 RepID=UPI0011B1E6D7|nr:hypothetical protein [Aminobacter sp. AP02]